MDRLLLVLLLTGALFACSSASESSSPTTPATASACLRVDDQVLDSLGLSRAGAAGPEGETGLGKPAYFVARADGAVWLTSEDPSSGIPGLTLPLNDQARSASDLGSYMPADALAFGDLTASSTGALQAIACAPR